MYTVFMWSGIKTVYIYVQPPFWQAWWFYIVCGLLSSGIIYSIFLLKINQLKAKQELLNKIARDLHDDIGSSLSGLGIYSRMALQNITTDKEDSKMLLQKISERCETVMDALSDIVWSVNTRNDAMDVILTKMREYTAEMLEPQKIDYIITVDEKAAKTKIGIKIRKEFYLVYKEAINNASKYAKCSQICVTINYVAKRLSLTVTDDGEGFTVGEHSKGNGLVNMRERAKKMRGILTVTSKKQQGTTVTLVIPLP
jgi:signal transduction histidine kinase